MNSSSKNATVLQRIAKLREQVRPVQIQILQKHGEAHKEMQEIVWHPQAHLCKLSVSELQSHSNSIGVSIDGCEEKSDLVKRLLHCCHKQQERKLGLIAALWSDTGLAPRCVCGSILHRVYGKALAERQVKEILATNGVPRNTPAYPRMFDFVMQRVFRNGTSGVFCDLCEKDVNITSGVWRCHNDDLTILHPTKYDVCDDCFVRHAFCESQHRVGWAQARGAVRWFRRAVRWLCQAGRGDAVASTGSAVASDCFLQVGCSQGGEKLSVTQSVLPALVRPDHGVEGFTLRQFTSAFFMLALLGSKMFYSLQKSLQKLEEPLIHI